jgi:proteasome lid subunit RPN8/RPN11
MILEVPAGILATIESIGERSYPEEGVGLLLGTERGDHRRVVDLVALPNVREPSARHHRYLVSPEDTLRVEEEADRRGLIVIGVCHSHPDHPSRPSDYDREWAVPFFSYIVTSVCQGRARETRCWHLSHDRSHFVEDELVVVRGGARRPRAEAGGLEDGSGPLSVV